MSRNSSVSQPPSEKNGLKHHNKIEIADHHLSNSELYRQQGDLGKSFAELSLALCILPSLKETYYSTYLEVFESWSASVEEKYGFKKSLTLFEVALKHYPESDDLKHLLAKILYRHGNVYEAWSYACLTHSGCPEDPNAQETHDHLTNALIDRWHLPMLNDAHRNLSFKCAIEEAVKQGHKLVLDVGSGTGLLSIYAKWAGAKEVYGCEINKFMCEIARGVLESNKNTSGIQTFNLHSHDLVITLNIPNRVSLVISEIVDAGLFGEHILSTLKHAWTHLLLPPAPLKKVQHNVKTVKFSVHSNLFSEENFKNHQSCPREKGSKSWLRLSSDSKDVDTSISDAAETVSGYNSSEEHGRVIPSRAEVYIALISCEYIAKYTKLASCEFSFFQNKKVFLRQEEPYLSEKLNQIPGGFQLLSDWIPLTEVDFNCPADIEKHLNGSVNKTLEIRCTKRGTPDAIILAFNLYTNDVHCISTFPESCSAAWENAIYPITTTSEVDCDDTLMIDFDCHGVIRLTMQDMSAPRAKSVNETLYLSSDAITFLNSQRYISSFTQAAEIITTYLRHNFRTNSSQSLIICDTMPFPIAGLLIVSQIPNAHLYVEEESIVTALNDMGIQAKLAEDLEDEINVLFIWPLTKEGTIREGIMKKILMYRLMMADDGLVFPKELELVLDAISSTALCSMTKVSNANMYGVKVEDVFNMAKTNHHVDIPLESLPQESVLSKPISVLRLSLVTGDVISLGESCETTDDNLLVLGGDVLIILAKVIAQKSSSVHAIPYWFTLRGDLSTELFKLDSSLSKPPSFCNALPSFKSIEFCSRDSDSPCNQSLLILDKYFNTMTGKHFSIKITWRDGSFSAKIHDVIF